MQDQDTASERWRPVVGYEHGYEVSDRGRVRSIPRTAICKNGAEKPIRGCTMRQQSDAAGYPMVTLWKDNHSTRVRVHDLATAAFLGPKPRRQQVRHINGDNTDNRLSNLLYGTCSENQMDRVAHGTSNRGEANGHAKLTADDVLTIRGVSTRGTSRSDLAAMYGVTVSCIDSIVRRTRWAWLE